jgi:hypothetical protein
MTIEADKAERTAIDRSSRRLFHLDGFPQLATATVLARAGGQLWQIALVLFVYPATGYSNPFSGSFPETLSCAMKEEGWERTKSLLPLLTS